MDPVAEMNSLPEKLQNGHKKKSKKKNKILTKTLEVTNEIVNNCSDNNNDSSVTEIDEISLQIDNCHIKENGLHENGVVGKVKKKKNKTKKSQNSNSSTLVEDQDIMCCIQPTAEKKHITSDTVEKHDSCCISSIETSSVENVLPDSSLVKNKDHLTTISTKEQIQGNDYVTS
jgi:hypothetical protein